MRSFLYFMRGGYAFFVRFLFDFSYDLWERGKRKKLSYIQLVAVVVIFIFLGICLGSQIFSFTKDLNQEAYVLYEGPAARAKDNVVKMAVKQKGQMVYTVAPYLSRAGVAQ